MSVSEHVPSFLVGALSLAMIISGYSFVYYIDSFKQKNAELTAKEVGNNIEAVSRFPEGYVQMDLESSFKFRFKDSGLVVVKDSKEYGVNTDGSVEQTENFQASKICLEAGSNVKVRKGEC